MSVLSENRDIAQLPLIMPSTPGLGIYDLIVKEFSRLGVEPHVICLNSS